MRIQVLSDLHMDAADWQPPLTDADLIVIAGDLYDDGRSSAKWCAELTQRHGKPVIAIAGNHEFYAGHIKQRMREIKAISEPAGVHWLNDESVAIGGVRFVGATLWTNFLANGVGMKALSQHACKDLVQDFYYIKMGRWPDKLQALSPSCTELLHKRSLRAIERRLEDAYEQPTVVITHHAPALRCLHDGFKGSLINSAFASPLEDFVAESMARVWIHGHLHHSVDFELGSTRVLCNPRGAGDYINAQFDPALVIEV